jgi:diguanylate cyclase
MNVYLVPLTSACILVTLNYMAMTIRSKMVVESYEHIIAPFFTGLACIIMMLQPLPPQLGMIDLRFLPIFMAGLRYGLPIALLSAVFPTIYSYFTASGDWIFFSVQDLFVPALLSSFFHKKEYQLGFSSIRIRHGLLICVLLFLIRLLFNFYLHPHSTWDYAADQLFMLLITGATFITLIVMVNDESKNWMLQRQLELQANQDSLTRLPNLRSFTSITKNAMKKRRISIFMIDIDNFKKFNDQLGHLEGDRLLRDIGGLLRHFIDEQDYVARYGGEEFILMSTQTDPHRLSNYAARLCEVVAANPFHEGISGDLPPITISIGITIANHPMDDLLRMISEADEALYESKHTGKNRFTLYHKLRIADIQ